MAHYQNIYNGGNGAPPVAQAAPRMTDWSGEVTPMPADPPMPEAPGRTVTSAGRPMDRLNAAEEQGGQSMGSLDMRNHLPSEVITDPISMEEAYRGSLKAMLKKNVGNYVVATFLVGTQSTTSWEGILYDVGNDYMTIYLCGTLFVMIGLGMNPFINAQGFGKTGMFTVVIGAVINIVLDPIFIFLMDMGVKGAALATVIAQGVSAVWVLQCPRLYL